MKEKGLIRMKGRVRNEQLGTEKERIGISDDICLLRNNLGIKQMVPLPR